MKDKERKRTRKLRNLIIVFALSAIIIAVSTYAWFIGMRTVNVSAFDVEIASTDDLALSLNGADWSDTVSISKTTIDTVSYSGHKNTWGGAGLVPASSIGEMDDTASRLILYEKASLTATHGGYRLMASRINNSGADELDGYVAFDLFVRNSSGRAYDKTLRPLDEEAIYLTVNSQATVALTGGEPGTGIENSVRVGFAQIGRVDGTFTASGTVSTPEIITGIKCIGDATVTGICRTAKIWEPNDRDHVKSAINWYNKACKKRIDDDVRDTDSYSGACETLTDGLAYPTYAVNDEIVAADNVDVYDGEAYNTYTDTTLLSAYPYFTDTMKYKVGMDRPEIMTLAPNSITKIRVYVWIEGQDIDNYDFASIGKAITINFGFTKERFTEEDIEYGGPILNQGEGPGGNSLTPPIITLLGDPVITLTATPGAQPYVDDGATAKDAAGNVIDPLAIEKSGTVNPEIPGEYLIVFRVKDADGNIGVKTRKVIVQ